jgi:hypothetical protein
MVQFRTLGGALCLAIASSVFNDFLRSHLRSIIGPQDMDLILKSVNALHKLSPHLQEEVIKIFSQGYNIQFKILIGFAGAQVPTTLLMWKAKQLLV